MITPYTSQQPVTDFGLRFSSLKFSAELGMGTEETVTVPGNAPTYKVIFKYQVDSSVWVALNETAVFPGAPTITATTSELNPICREVKAGEVLHFISQAQAHISLVFYALRTTN